MTKLRDQIAESGEPIEVPEAVLDDADRRTEEMTADPSACLTEEEMRRQADGLQSALR